MILFVHPEAQRFIDSLPNNIGGRVDRGLRLLEEYGRLLAPPDSKKISGELFELRVRTIVQVRLIYGFSGNMTLVVHGFVKKSSKIPLRELRLAHHRFRTLAG